MQGVLEGSATMPGGVCRDSRNPPSPVSAILANVVVALLSVTFACGLIIAVAHVLNHRFVAPTYDVVANLTAFTSAVAASSLLGHWIPATLSGIAILCWLILARRTVLAKATQKRKEAAA